MNTPQASQEIPPPAGPPSEFSPESYGQLVSSGPDLSILTALCLAAGRNGQPPDVRAKEALILAKAVRDAVDGDTPPPPPAADGPVLERGTIGASMLQRQVGEANTRIAELEDLCAQRSADAQAANERVVALEAELRQVNEQLAAAKTATSTGTSGPAPRPPKSKPESKPEE